MDGWVEGPLPRQGPLKSHLETWFVRHRIDVSSPRSQQRLHDLAFMNISLRVFDTAFIYWCGNGLRCGGHRVP